jgi:phospholipase C
MRLASSFLVLLMVGLATVAAHAQISNFQHIVVVFQENRTPDNLFQGLCGINRTLCPNPYDIQNFGIDSRGQTVSLTSISLGSPLDPEHTHKAFGQMCDLDTATNQCKMDGADKVKCDLGHCSFSFVSPSDVGPYLTIAQQYGWANFMFQTNQGPSQPAHQFIFGGTSAPTAADDAAATFAEGFPNKLGCLAPLNSIDRLISPQTAPGAVNLVNNPLGTVCY